MAQERGNRRVLWRWCVQPRLVHPPVMQVRLVALAFVALLAGCKPKPAAPSPVPAPTFRLASGAFALESVDGGLPVVLSRSGEALARLDADGLQFGAVRALDDTLSYDPYWLVHKDAVFNPTSPPGLHWLQPTSAKADAPHDGQLVLHLTFDGGMQGRLELSLTGEGRFSARLIPEGTTPIAFTRLRLRATGTERYYGLGEWFDGVEQRGKVRPMQLEPDLFIESSDTENHVTVPLLLSSRTWGLFVESRRPGLFDVGASDPEVVEVTFGTASESAGGLAFHLFAADAPLDLLQHYYALTGAPRLPAPWALGPWLWRNEDRDQAQVGDDIQAIRDLDLATSGIWIDRPYASAVNSFDFDPARYTDAGPMIAHTQAEGLRFALWHTPYAEEAAQPFRAQAEDAGYFPPTHGLLLNGWSPPIDFTNPEATAWWQEQVRRYTALGVEGFKLDFAEDVSSGVAGGRSVWAFADGSDERTMQSRYALLYHQTYAALLPQEGGFLLCRAARWGDQVNGPIIWPGDIDATLTRFGEALPFPDGGSQVGVGGLPSALQGALSLSASGFPFFAADTGGYRGSPADKETWLRWVEQSALGVVMQTGDASSGVPWDRDADSLDTYRTYARLHARLFPYLWTYVTQLGATGRPVLRPLGLAYPELSAPPQDEYLVGEDLLVAPVVEAGARLRHVVFPPGEWVSWSTGTKLDTEATVDAPLEVLPLFARAGAIVPLLRPTIDTLAPADDANVESFARDPGKLWLRVFAGTGAITLYDGTALQQSPGALSVTPGSVFAQGVSVEWLGAARPSAVRESGTDVPAWNWTSDAGGTLTFDLGPGAHRVDLVP